MQQWKPRIANDRLQLCVKLQLALTTHMVESEQQVMTVGQLRWQMNLYLIIETWTPAQ